MDRAMQSMVDEQQEAKTVQQVRLRLAVIDRCARPDTELPEQAISFTRTFPAPGEVGSCTVIRGTGHLTVGNLLVARQALSQALFQVRHELGVHGHADEID